MTDIASVMRPSSVIASASSKRTQRDSMSSVGSGSASPATAPRREHDRLLVGNGVREMGTGPARASPSLPRRSPRATRAGSHRRRLPGRHAALGDLPRHRVEGVAVLAHEQDAIGLIEHDDARGEVCVVDDPVDARTAVRPGDDVVPDGDPVVLVGETPRVPPPRPDRSRRVRSLAHRRTRRAPAGGAFRRSLSFRRWSHDQSDPEEIRPASQPIHGARTLHDVRIPVSDGLELSANLWPRSPAATRRTSDSRRSSR